ncbi:hypothetical protein [Bradyrhizobium japonicum]|uniref:hypothetical protein n=1 Tax=Bradyrhizobium japonicum TaxID=375 RepID=UPI00047F30B0|nr:hypothetical protein [Bradyrhizobium japonicum]MCP1738209.1 hypothetical protein [Bradyrhizobium japonicum]MCP1855993.1 hypothetical protein [Bradyrhizobium japonicum]MCP1897192.1 hypothetical protein [Bradyrhizobium japonicum]MCW2330760.1 hypothetical protein [Bradyrhizobium japonicum]WLB96024.1 hypothetical protein QIH92_41360 [Bradyrhizobium japonicum USDA 123]
MRRIFFAAIAATLLITPSILAAQPFKLKQGSRWIIFASREDLREASKLARDLSAARPDIRVFRSINGWYTVAAGPLPISSAESTKDGLISSGKIPPDSYLSVGGRFVEDVTTQAKSQELSVPSSKEVEQALALLAAAFANPLANREKKEVHNGVQLFFNSTVYKQAFLGSQTHLKYSFSEQITQDSQPGLGGSYQTTYRHQVEAAFKDLQHAWIHGDENETINRRITLNCSARRACVSTTSEGRLSKSDAVDLMFRDNQAARDALLAIDTLIRANRS